MKISHQLPDVALRPYISRYWSWQNADKLPPLLPGAGCELFFYYQNRVAISQPTLTHGTTATSLLLLPRCDTATTISHTLSKSVATLLAIHRGISFSDPTLWRIFTIPPLAH